MATVQLVRVLGSLLCLLGIVLCWEIGRLRFSALSTEQQIAVGNATLSMAAFWKLTAFAALVLVPAATVMVVNYHTFAGTHAVGACARCHIMRPMVNDMMDATSETLAARHFRNRWIPQDQCYNCHSDYGFSGNVQAKLEGFRHLVRYTTRTYTEPIAIRGHFDNNNCLKCHATAPRFEAVRSHQTVRGQLDESALSCLNCHGAAHPTRTQRTPGSADYARLMEPVR
jgi:nitrate/TMAO reductase-like tetraheme cytochrome c subunit